MKRHILLMLMSAILLTVSCGGHDRQVPEETNPTLEDIAELGDVEAQFQLGVCYYRGEGVAQDFVEAVRWFHKAAEQGDAPAQYNLGVCYYFGRGVAQDFEEAFQWYRQAAEQGDAKAQFNLAVCYGQGHGVKRNHEEGIKWLRKSAAQGNEEAVKLLNKFPVEQLKKLGGWLFPSSDN